MKVKRENAVKIGAAISGISGMIILVWVFSPILFYELSSPPVQTFLSPLSSNNGTINTTSSVDYTKASNWFPTAKNNNTMNESASFYEMSIPSLGINDAKVLIGGEDLSQSLIQYPGTALPGQNGDAVVFGHSVLPSFYNPTNYLTIFSTLPTLVAGDVITIKYDGITYKYQVEDKFEVQPTDIGILDQDESDSFLSLVTCVPPGLQTRRLVVKARIVPVRST